MKALIQERQVLSRNKSWTNTPGFRTLQSTGANLPDNAFSYSEARVAPSWGRVQSSSQGWVDVGPYAGLPNIAPAFDMTDRRQELNQLLISRAKSSQFNAPVFFAEAGKTADMVLQRATHLAEMARDLKRGRFGDFAKKFHKSVVPPGGRARARFDRNYGRNAMEAASNAWLEYSYGWVPFMSEVRSATNTLMDLADRPKAMTSKVKAVIRRSSETVSTPQRLLAFSTPPGCELWGILTTRKWQSYKGTWRFRPNPSDMPGRFGLVNPAEVVWELVPFSFVADWFLPIGDYLAALDVPLRFSHVGGSYGTRIYAEATIEPLYGSTGFAGVSSYVSVGRQPMTSAPSLTLRGMKPTGILESVPKLLSAISLLGQQVAGLSPKPEDLRSSRRLPMTSRRKKLTEHDWYG